MRRYTQHIDEMASTAAAVAAQADNTFVLINFTSTVVGLVYVVGHLIQMRMANRLHVNVKTQEIRTPMRTKIQKQLNLTNGSQKVVCHSIAPLPISFVCTLNKHSTTMQ